MRIASRRKARISKIAKFAAFLPLCFAIAYSASDFFKATYGALTLDTKDIIIKYAQESEKPLKIRRKIQKHFLNTGVYIPMEDIVFSKNKSRKTSRLNLLMQKACGKGTLYIWIPMRFKWPIIGERVFDWCWKE